LFVYYENNKPTNEIIKKQMQISKQDKEQNALEKKDTNWNLFYLVVFLFLVLQIIFYYFITKHFQ